jgi:hypothetical protein
LTIGSRDAFGREFAGLSADHVLTHFTTKTRSTGWVERAWRLFQYIRGRARRASGERKIFRADLAPHLVGLELEGDLLALR